MATLSQLLDAFEHQVGHGLRPDIFAVVAALLRLDAAARKGEGAAMTPLQHLQNSNRFAACWQKLMLSPQLDFRGSLSLDLLGNLHALHAMVHASAAGSNDAAMRELLARTGGSLDGANLARLLLLWVPNSTIRFSPFQHLALARGLVTAQALATIGGNTLCSEAADRARNEAIGLLLSGTMTLADLLPFCSGMSFARAWMQCSYATHPGKHRVKVLLNEVIRADFGRRDAAAAAATTANPLAGLDTGGKPLLLVFLENAWQGSGAMTRVFAPVMQALRERFYTVALAVRSAGDNSTARHFDRLFVVEDLAASGGNISFPQLVHCIRGARPDVLYFPSLGMSILSVVLANFRLATLQVMSLGHPATSHSPEMDALLTEAGYAGSPDSYSERVVLLPRGTMAFQGLPTTTMPMRLAGPDAEGCINIAIPALSHKLSWPLLRALAVARARSPRRLRFHFLTGMRGAAYFEAVQQVDRHLRDSVVHASLTYNEYMHKIAGCHVHVASFPFGGTNSLVDSMSLGLPVVALEGPEPHQTIDAEFLRRIGLGDELVAHTEEGFVALLVRLANDDAWRLALGERTLAAIAGGALLSGGHPGRYGDALWELLQEKGGALPRP